ncbi:MAG: divergent polysaccharide deacetylase family protein [Candidatus Omnitrophota bacterium]
MKNRFLFFSLIILIFFIFIALILIPVKKKPIVKKAFVSKGEIAIVIDDWGYHLDNLSIIEGIKQPLTCAVLPNLKNSALVAQDLNKLKCEIILHLPMQPKEKFRLESNTITLDMDSQQILGILNRDLASVIFAKGLSNHMGSAITENEQITSIIMTEAKRRKLYFLDSFVTAKSICKKTAKKTGIKFAQRNIFLDNQNDLEYIKGQIVKLKNLAGKYGTAIGIGHDRKITLLALKEMLPQLESQGYKFVFVSEATR